MAICKFFQEGRCRFGDACRNQHVSNSSNQWGGGGGGGGYQGGGQQNWGNHRGDGGGQQTWGNHQGGGGGQQTWGNHRGSGGRGDGGGFYDNRGNGQAGQAASQGWGGQRGGGGAVGGGAANPFQRWTNNAVGAGAGAGAGAGNNTSRNNYGNQGGRSTGANQGHGLTTSNPFNVLTKLGPSGTVQTQAAATAANNSQSPFFRPAAGTSLQLWSQNAQQATADQATPKAGGTSKKPLSMTELRDVIKNDMKVWEDSKMWPLSCYTFAQRQPNLLGFEDLSPEEMRWACVQAKYSNTLPQHEAEVGQVGAQHLRVRQMYVGAQDASVQQQMVDGLEKYNADLLKHQQEQQQQTAPGFPQPAAAQGLFTSTPAGGSFVQAPAFAPQSAGKQQAPGALVNPFQVAARAQQASGSAGGISSSSTSSAVASNSETDSTLPAATAEQLEVFRKLVYGLGEIPEVPPPLSVC